ncbi:MAG: bifunctional pyr operon transcriptional regulator/uracil phosphoribosyltransferase PyrR [Gammaproteobacteria bacterium]|nr:MAG: bifunctional pyr operon transcriptional regulator/uracil phosphoribosyltransferase PyrR [Gammaproteobacteria bacterium]
MTTKTEDPGNVDEMLEDMAAKLRGKMASRPDPIMIGIHTGGVVIASRLHDMLGIAEPLGSLDISFYRDDFSRIGMNPQVRPSQIPMSIDDRHIILVDDVLYTGRTIRAALNEIFDYGRPASVLLAVLVERSGRELPVAADVVGKQLVLKSKEHIKLTEADILSLSIMET